MQGTAPAAGTPAKTTHSLYGGVSAVRSLAAVNCHTLLLLLDEMQ